MSKVLPFTENRTVEQLTTKLVINDLFMLFYFKNDVLTVCLPQLTMKFVLRSFIGGSYRSMHPARTGEWLASVHSVSFLASELKVISDRRNRSREDG